MSMYVEFTSAHTNAYTVKPHAARRSWLTFDKESSVNEKKSMMEKPVYLPPR